jgi:hypothetical protein
MALFIFLILNVIVDTGNIYDKDFNSVSGKGLNITKYNQTLTDITQNPDPNTYDERFISGSIDNVDNPSGFLSITQDISNFVKVPFVLISDVMIHVLYIPAFVVYVLLIILVISVIFGLWRAIRSGE